jgi:peptidoglycan/LPS O-acetylase OafA/YrhL
VFSLGPGLHHTAFEARALAYGGLGVDLFFALSGYLLFWPFVVSQFGEGAAISARRYALNRALRILPLYYATVALLLALRVNGVNPSQWWRFALFIQDYSNSTVYRLDAPMWSLGVELQFYVLLPLLALGLARLAGRSTGRAAWMLGALALASLLAYERPSLGLGALHATNPLIGPFALPTLFVFFASGMLLALLRHAWGSAPPARLRGRSGHSDLWLLAGIVAWLVAAAGHRTSVMALASFLMIGACVLPLRQGPLTGFLARWPLPQIGIASYSLYLLHVPIMQGPLHLRVERAAGGVTVIASSPHGMLVLIAAFLPICLLAAGVSYAVVERPFLSLRRRWSGATHGSALAGAANPPQLAAASR